MPIIITETSRLTIRSWTNNDVAPYAAILADPEVMQYIGDGATRPYSEAIRAVEKYNAQMETQGWARFAVELKESKELIGFCGYDFYNNELDLGWRLAKKHWGNGYATEAAKAVLKIGKDQFSFPRIVCTSHEENLASINVIEKLGLRFEKEIYYPNKGIVKKYSIEAAPKKEEQ